MSHELKTGGDRGYLRIATEEAFATREQVDVYLRMVKDGTADRGLVSLWGFYARSTSERATQVMEGLLDLGDMRIRNMDATGIDKAILALTAPGAQPIVDVSEARGVAQRANDLLAEHVSRRPDRYIGMTTVAPQDPAWSASEILRGARSLGLQGRTDKQPYAGSVSRRSKIRSDLPSARRLRSAAVHPSFITTGRHDRTDAGGRT